MQIVVVWNTAARLRLNNYNPTWTRDLAHDIDNANWKHKNISIEPLVNATQELKLDSRGLMTDT